jgi:hypothetical protein
MNPRDEPRDTSLIVVTAVSESDPSKQAPVRVTLR